MIKIVIDMMGGDLGSAAAVEGVLAFLKDHRDVEVTAVGKIEELTSEERSEIFALLDTTVRVIKEAMNPGGFNIGMNIGSAAGAGIEEHIHVHVIPRWEGDTNFMSVVTNVRVIPEAIQKTAANLTPLFKKYCREE